MHRERTTHPEGARPCRLRPTRVARLQTRLLGWYANHGRDLPWRHATDPYAILVSEIMLQQTQVSRVVPRFREFLDAYPTLEDLAGADLGDVLATWSGLGYNNRAERLVRCARTAGAALPSTLDDLLRLPGVGPYTARAVLIFSRNADLAAVDANVRRVLTHELGLPHGLSPADLQAVADAALPAGRSRDWHNALMDYGALVLTGRVTGIAPRSRQGRFAGSRRFYRAAAVRLLLSEGALPAARLAERLAIGEPAMGDVLDSLARDGLVEIRGAEVAVARASGAH